MTQENKVYGVGSIVRVKFGSRGTRKAVITQSIKRDRNGYLYYKAEKYNAAQENFTKPVKVFASEILGPIVLKERL